MPGMFAVGDVRSKSVKRVASAVGEGSVVISDVHRYLADHHNSFAVEPNSALAALRSASSRSACLGKILRVRQLARIAFAGRRHRRAGAVVETVHLTALAALGGSLILHHLGMLGIHRRISVRKLAPGLFPIVFGGLSS